MPPAPSMHDHMINIKVLVIEWQLRLMYVGAANKRELPYAKEACLKAYDKIDKYVERHNIFWGDDQSDFDFRDLMVHYHPYEGKL